MTRHGLVFSAAILSVIAVPQGSHSQSVEGGIRIAQAEQQQQPERRPDERRPERPGQRQQGTPGTQTPAQTPAAPGQQRPPTANAPARPAAPATAQPATPQRPTPPATGQTQPNQPPPGAPTTAQPVTPQRPAPPATAQTPPNQPPLGAPPPAAQTPPNQRPPAPAAVQTQPTQPQRQGGPAVPVPGAPPAAQQNVAPPVGQPAAPVQAPAAQTPAQPGRPVIGQPAAPVPQAPAAPAVQAPVQPGRPVIGQPAAPVPQAPGPAVQTPAQPNRPVIGQPVAPVPQAPTAPAAQVPAQPQRPAAAIVAPAPAALNPAQANAPVDPRTMPQHLEQLRSARHETQEGNRVVIQEADRVIIREGGQDIIRHNEADRFRFNAREVNVERRGNDTVTVVLRPDGTRIVTETDETGRLLRRVRREPDGREVIIIDNSFQPPPSPGALAFVVNLPAPVIRIPREVYIRETARATPEDIFFTLTAPPVEPIQRRYALDEIRFSQPLRERMPRVDIDTVNFESGSWEISPDQVQRLAYVADGLRRAVQRNPREVFLVEGYTDAIGNDVDNLSLSDRRAESVAVTMTNQFGVPAENLATQGFGKQFLKIPTEGPERANRRVAVRRITPLLLGQN